MKPTASATTVRLEKTWRADHRDAPTRQPKMQRALELGVLLVESQDADLLARVLRIEDDEAIELSDQRPVVEVVELWNLAARALANYAAETKMTEATKAGNMTPSELRSMIQWAVVVGNIGTSVLLGFLYLILRTMVGLSGH